MSCKLLLALLSVGDPMQVSEGEIRLAIDLMARGLRPGLEVRLPSADHATQCGLLELLNDHDALLAEWEDGEIVLRRME